MESRRIGGLTCGAAAVGFAELVQSLDRQELQTRRAELVFEQVRPHVAELGEFDMRANPLLKEVRDAHDFAHELVDAVVTLAQVDEIGFCEAFTRAP